MASVDYVFPVDKVHGKIAKTHKVGFAHRRLSGLNYTTVYGKRTTAPSITELEQRAKFAAVCAAARARLRDPDRISQDQAAFRDQSTYKTMWSFIFNLEWAEYQA